MIGVSMISPDGLAIRPRMPPSCFIWACEPRAPELAIIHTELISASRPSMFFGAVEISAIISSDTRSVALDQASTTLLYFSPLVIRPSAYCCSYSSTSLRVVSMIPFLALGIMMSSLPNEMPALAASRKPRPMIWSAKMTVAF